MELHELVLADARAFMKSRVILTAAELDFFTILDAGPATAEALASSRGLDLRATTRLLDSLVTFSLLTKSEGVYSTTERGALLSSRNPRSVLPMVHHLERLWDSWGQLTDVVRGGPPQTRIGGGGMDERSRRAFIGAMHVVGRSLSVEVAKACDLGRFKRLLDIGGASGTYTIAFLRENPGMGAVIFDLPAVIPMAEERIASEGLAERVDLVRGDFYTDELPKGCDLALLSAIVHQNSQEENLELYKKIHRALESGGSLIIRDHVMDEARTNPPAGAMFAINMLVNTPGGDTYTFDELREGLESAGFRDVRLIRFGERMDSLVEAVA